MEQLKWTSDDIVVIALVVGAVCAELTLASVIVSAIVLFTRAMIGCE